MHRILAFLLIAIIAATFVTSSGCGVAKDTQLQLKIKEALAADKTIEAGKLTVNVAAGVVTISGKINTKDEIDRVVQLVQAIPGVVQVKNQMSLPDNSNSVNPTFLDYPLN
jgi:hypothetical protein